jgi:hypothetical protein
MWTLTLVGSTTLDVIWGPFYKTFAVTVVPP